LADLERELEGLAGAIAWPPTPRFAATPRVARPPYRWLLPAAAVLLAAALLLLASPPARDAIATFLGIRGVNIERVQHPPTPSPLRPGPLGEGLGLGSRVTLGQARAQAGFPVLLPASLDSPDEAYFDSRRHMVTLVYAARPGLPSAGETGTGLLISEFPGQLNQDSFAKVVGPGTALEPVDLGSGRAYFIGGGHVFILYSGPAGVDESRLAANTLIWQRGEVLIRVEANLDQAQESAIARSLG
jgi:hypothetical protein